MRKATTVERVDTMEEAIPPVVRARRNGPLGPRSVSQARVDERSLTAAILTGALTALCITHLLIASFATVPRGPDNIGPWAVAFQVAGAEPSIDMYDLPPYSVGMGALLSPLVRLVDDPTLRFQIAIGGLGLLVLGAGVAIWRYLRHIGRCSPLALAAAFASVTMLTSTVYASSYTWAEALALAWLAGWVAAAGWAVTRRGPLAVATIGVLTGTGILVHGRFVGVCAAWITVVALAAGWDLRQQRTEPRRAAVEVAAAVGATAVTYLICSRLRFMVTELAWSKVDFDSDAAFTKSMGSARYWWGVGKALLGQSWYLITSTFGLAPVGVWALVTWCRPGTAGPELARPRRLAAIAALLGLGSVLLISVLSWGQGLMEPPPSRPDFTIASRYIDAVVVILAGIGVAWLLDTARRSSIRVLLGSVLSIFVFGATVAWIDHTSGTSPVAFLDASVSGVAAWPFDRPGMVDVWRWCMISGLAGSVIICARWRGRVTTGITLYVILVLATIAGTVAGAHAQSEWDNRELYVGYPAAPTGLSSVLVASDAMTSSYYRFNSPSQQYALANRGWTFTISDQPSDALTANLPPDAGMIVLPTQATPPAGAWCEMPPSGSVRIFAKVGEVIAGAEGGRC